MDEQIGVEAAEVTKIAEVAEAVKTVKTAATDAPSADAPAMDAPSTDAPAMDAPAAPACPLGGLGKKIGIALLCAMLFFAAVAYAGFVVTPKDNGPDDGVIKERCMSIFAEPENTLDVVYLGNSVLTDAVDPLQMWESSGIASYVAGYNGQRSYSAVSLLNKIAEVQSPRAVVFDADILYNLEQPEFTLYQIVDDLFPVATYHQRWKDVTLEDFYTPVNYTHIDATKGHIIREKVTYTKADGYMDKDKDYIHPGKISEMCLSMLKKKCDEMGADLIVLAVPTVVEWSHGKHNCLQDLADKYGFTFIDMNADDSVGIDWDQDSRDCGIHLNYAGAKKVTKKLQKELQTRYPDLVDHRDDPTYQAAWNDILPYYHKLLDQAKSGERVM